MLWLCLTGGLKARVIRFRSYSDFCVELLLGVVQCHTNKNVHDIIFHGGGAGGGGAAAATCIAAATGMLLLHFVFL